MRRARVRFDARDYRAALAEATAALTHDPGNAEAAQDQGRRRSAARGTGAACSTRPRAAIAAGDGVGAAGLVAQAQELAPGDARVAEVVGAAARPSSQRAGPQVGPSRVRAPPPAAPAGAARRTAGPTGPAAGHATPPAPPPYHSARRPPDAPAAAAPPRRRTARARRRSCRLPSPPRPSGSPSRRSSRRRRRRRPAAPEPPPAPAPAAESDDAAIRRVIATYERAIESKDLALFRSVRPGLSADEERRLRASFDQVTRQQIDIRIETITVTGDTATARLARQDTLGDGRSVADDASTQTLRLARRNAGWIIVELGR